MSVKFENSWSHDKHGLVDILRWKLGIGEREQAQHPQAPDLGAPTVALDPEAISSPPESGWRITWLGHASFLIQGAGKSILADPVLSSHCSPLPLPGLKRMVQPPCKISDLPRIDAVLLTHSHYDHMDLSTLRKLGVSTPLFTPAGHSRTLGKKGFREITEIAWWQTVETATGLRFTAVPAQHFTARTPFDRNRAHWCGWMIEGAGSRIWHAGDSGYCPAFSDIGMHFGGIDFGMIPIGAYQPRNIMEAVHMNPEEAVRAFLDTGCRRAVGMHWGTFRLTDEPMGEPPLLLGSALRASNIAPERFQAGVVGKIINLPRPATT